MAIKSGGDGGESGGREPLGSGLGADWEPDWERQLTHLPEILEGAIEDMLLSLMCTMRVVEDVGALEIRMSSRNDA